MKGLNMWNLTNKYVKISISNSYKFNNIYSLKEKKKYKFNYWTSTLAIIPYI